MTRYSTERKEAVLKKLLPPFNKTVAEISRQEDISIQTLYAWRDKAKKVGVPVPGKSPKTEDWSAEAKLAVILQTAVLSESELNEYCRKKGLYREQIVRWKEACLSGFQGNHEQNKIIRLQTKADRDEIKALKKELRIKEKALAETAALLVLRKKLSALWDEDEEN